MDLDNLDYRKPLITVIGAVIANLAVVAYAIEIVGTSPEFQPLTYGAVAFVTAISGIGAWLVLELKKQYVENPYEKFLKVASFVLIASWVTILYAVEEPGAGMNEIAMLSLTHVVAAVTTVSILLKLEFEEKLLE